MGALIFGCFSGAKSRFPTGASVAEQLHPTATEHLPAFITAARPDGRAHGCHGRNFGARCSDVRRRVLSIAHSARTDGSQVPKDSVRIVAILGLISLFTHMHIFWIAGLLLAVIDIPDFGNSLLRIAGSAEKMAGLPPGEGAVEIPPDGIAGSTHAEGTPKITKTADAGIDGAAVPIRPEVVHSSKGS